MSKVERALDYLNHLIETGWEYPAARFKVCRLVRLSKAEQAELTKLYDDN